MTDQEMKKLEKALKKQRKEVNSSKEAAGNLLRKLGIITAKGNFTKAFRPAK